MLERPSAILRTTFFFWLLAKLISYKVWLADRFFPVVPSFNFFPELPSWFHLFLFASSLFLLIFLLVFPKNNPLLLSLLIIEIAACSLDITRWQPWEYQYLFMVLVFLINKNDDRKFFSAILFLLSMIYIFSGMHKFNGAYLFSTWGRMILGNFLGFSLKIIANIFVHYAGLLLPIIEIIGGLALLFLKNKKIPALVLMAMHVFILLLIGPTGIDYNSVVWPWNVAMIVFLYFLFFRGSVDFSFKKLLKGANPIVIIFWTVLPLLNFIGYWDLYLSSGLYSGKEIRMDICFSKTEKTKDLLQYTNEKWAFVDCGENQRIPLFQWSFEEMNVPPYPALWYYKKFKTEWVSKYGSADFILYEYPYSENNVLE
ncbi:MAG TPA: hypothetical protein VFM82_01125 [Flavobacteriaceae bacterium]|nr:hypothetical protein [Flavobacteriaceae bacterium]